MNNSDDDIPDGQGHGNYASIVYHDEEKKEGENCSIDVDIKEEDDDKEEEEEEENFLNFSMSANNCRSSTPLPDLDVASTSEYPHQYPDYPIDYIPDGQGHGINEGFYAHQMDRAVAPQDARPEFDAPINARARVNQYGAGRPVKPPKVWKFVDAELPPSNADMTFLATYASCETVQLERINEQLIRMHDNGIELKNLDRLDEMKDPVPLDEHVGRVFDVFIRHVLAEAGGNLKTTRYWVRLIYPGDVPQMFHLWHVTYSNGSGHVLMNNLALHIQSNKEFHLDGKLKLSMFIFKDRSDSLGGAREKFDEKTMKKLGLKRQFVIIDGYCLPVSLAIGKARSDELMHPMNSAERQAAKNLYKSLTKTDKDKQASVAQNQLKAARKLLEDCGLNVENDLHDDSDLEIMARKLSNYRISVWARRDSQAIVKIKDYNLGAPGFIALYYEKKHYETFNPKAGLEYLNVSYCFKCRQLIEHEKKNSHASDCITRCYFCGFNDCAKDENPIELLCPTCGITFQRQACYDRHLQRKRSGSHPHCVKYRFCAQCGKNVRTVFKSGGVEHECFTNYCNICRQQRKKDHDCTHPPPTKNQREACLQKQENWCCLVYDVETIVTSTSQIPTQLPTKGPDHVPNLICAQLICKQCYGERKCNHCQGVMKFSYVDEKEQGSATSQFVKFLVTDKRLDGCILLAHNGGKYDHGFILSALIEEVKVEPDLLMNGNQTIQATVNIPPKYGQKRGTVLKFKDSLNFLPMALSQMPAAFGFEELSKGTFPYMYNHPDHYDDDLPTLPDIQYYLPEYMSPAAREKFELWYKENKHKGFNFGKVILKYCEDDVQILVKAISCYLRICEKIFKGWNPIVQSCTLAGFVMFVMSHEYIKPGTIGYIPENGFPDRVNSVLALKYLQWIDSQDPNLKIEHSLNGQERKLVCGQNNYYADGYSASTNTVYEVNGCMWHGCKYCFRARTAVVPGRSKTTFAAARNETITRQKNIEYAGYKVVAKWECDIRRELANNPEMKKFFEECRHTHNLLPRESMFGGRTQPFQVFAEADEFHTVEFQDFCSLYPWTNMKGAEYPIGQPQRIKKDFKKIEDGKPLPYRGLVFCDLSTPDNVPFGVAPYRARVKLLFPLCRTCALRPTGKECTHIDENQRYLTGTWVTEELNLAIEMGYKVKKIHEVWHWPDDKWFRGGFFQDFLGPLLQLKHEASGWPRANMTDAEKTLHVEKIKKNDGVDINPQQVAKNAALRQMAKLFLNSAWGKFAQNPQKAETKILDKNDGVAIFNFFNSSLHEPKCLELWGANHLLVSRSPLREGLEPAKYTNVVYGSITTAIARIRLYEAMRRVGPENLIYCDTDSVIFRQKKGEDLLGDLRGDGLGLMTDEVPAGSRILEVVTVAPKVYALKMVNEKGEISYKIKAKGMTLNSITRKNVTFDSMKKMALDSLHGLPVTPLVGVSTTIRRPAKRGLAPPACITQAKRMTPVTDKGVLEPRGLMRPYGALQSGVKVVDNYPFKM